MIRDFKRAGKGFTLVEVLVAVIISTLIMGAAYATWHTATVSWTKERSNALNYQYGRAAMSMVERTLKAALPPSAEDEITFEGESAVIKDTELAADYIRFTTTNSLFLIEDAHSSDLKEIELYLDFHDESGEPSLMMRHRLIPSTNEEYLGEVDELVPNVASFDVKYHDGFEFLDEWTYVELPEAIQVSLILYNFEDEANPVRLQKLIVPVMQ